VAADDPPKQESQPPSFTPEQATAAVRRVYFEGFSLIQTKHFREELAKADATMQDVENVLEHGHVLRAPEWKAKHRSWNYAVAGRDIEGEPLTIVVAIDERRFSLILVTAW
jgi:hypothetical protein